MNKWVALARRGQWNFLDIDRKSWEYKLTLDPRSAKRLVRLCAHKSCWTLLLAFGLFSEPNCHYTQPALWRKYNTMLKTHFAHRCFETLTTAICDSAMWLVDPVHNKETFSLYKHILAILCLLYNIWSLRVISRTFITSPLLLNIPGKVVSRRKPYNSKSL